MAAWGAAPEKEVAGECGNTAGGKPRGGDAARGRAGAIEGDGAHLRPLQRPPVASALRPLQGRGTQRQEGHGRRCGGGRACQNSCVSVSQCSGEEFPFPYLPPIHFQREACFMLRKIVHVHGSKIGFSRIQSSEGHLPMVLYTSDRNSARGIRFRASSEELAARVHKQNLVHE
jgi:hypothetical protein